MDSFIKNITQKLSINDLVDMMKESKVIDEDAIKEEDVRKTFAAIDPDALLDVEELTVKLNEISEDLIRSKNNTAATENILKDELKEDNAQLDMGENIEKRNWKLEDDVKDETKFNVTVLEKNNEPEKLQKNDSDFLRALGKERNDFSLYDDFYYF